MACSFSPRAFAQARAPSRDTTTSHRMLQAARDYELREISGDSTRSNARPASPPACAPPRGSLPHQRPECATGAEHLPSEDHPDYKCVVNESCKKVRFADVNPHPSPAGSSSLVDLVVGSGQSSGTGRSQPEGEQAKQAVQEATRGPDCPCRAAFAPCPPSSLATGDIYRTYKLPKRFQYPVWFSGYNSGPKHPLYRTTASDIGRFPPTVHTVTTIYRPADRSMSKMLVPAGPWRNRSLCHTGSIWDIYDYNNFY